MKILIVDDETLARERLCELIMELDPGISFSQAENGLQALETIQKEQPDIVLLDIRMPVMDGLETAQHITRVVTGHHIYHSVSGTCPGRLRGECSRLPVKTHTETTPANRAAARQCA
jgi:CheY-like chemotaxis protein